MRNTIAATVVIVIAALASAVPVEAHCTWSHPGHCIKGAVKPLEEIPKVAVDVIKGTGEVLEEIAEETAEILKKTSGVLKEAGRDIDDEILQPAKEAAEEAGRDIDDEIFQPAKDYLTRCYDRAEREPDPETRKARWKECEERQTGPILGTIGLAAGSVFGPGGAALGSLAGSVAGSAIDGAPNVFVKVRSDLPATEPPDLGQPRATPERQPSSRAALGTALELVPEIFEWLGIANVSVQTVRFEQDRIRLASQVPFGKTVDAWVLIRGDAYSDMTFNPSGFWIAPGHEQRRIKIIGTMDAHSSGGECNHPSHPPLCHGDSPGLSIP